MKRLLKKEKGFTLVELLVVIGIIVALAAVIIPNIARFAGEGDTAASGSELQTVQTAMDTAMADLGYTAVAAGTAITDFSNAGGGDIDLGTGTAYLYPDYLRTSTAGYGPYDWTTEGLVSQ